MELLGEIEAEADEAPDETPPGPAVAPSAAPEAGDREQPASNASSVTARGADPVLLRDFDDLTLEGSPILIEGDQSANGHSGPTAGGPRESRGLASTSRHAGLGTDLSALDALGMRIAVAYEILRLRRAGHGDADLLFPGLPLERTSFVVDVHTPRAIAEAREGSEIVARVMTELQSCGVSMLYPGCDLLSIRAGEIDRVIELKSSTVDARTQEMSWNEWKTARSNDLRRVFWLYLVGNLRADLDRAVPFVRAINDPFGALVADETTERHMRRAVQLRVREFPVAEHLDLGIRSVQVAESGPGPSVPDVPGGSSGATPSPVE